MIDVDGMEAQLIATVDESQVLFVAAPVPAAPPRRRRRVEAQAAPRGGPASVPELLALGRLVEVDDCIAAATDRRNRRIWTTMRALLDGCEDAARAGLGAVQELGGDAEAMTGAWAQRFWIALEWGSAEERHDMLDHCRERAYRFDDLQWWGDLTLLLAAMGKADEATRAFDATLRAVVAGGFDTDPVLDAVTNLVDAAAMLADPGRVAAAGSRLPATGDRLVVVGAGVVCKGSIDRFLGLTHAARGQWSQAGECFRRAEAVHRTLGAGLLLTRTLQQARGNLEAA